MKKKEMSDDDRVCGLVGLTILLILQFLFGGCSKGPAELGEQIKSEMQSVYAAKPGMHDLEMTGVYLVADSNDVYRGVGVGEINGKEIRFSVKCRRDGSTVLWGAELEGVADKMVVAGECLNDAGRIAREKLVTAQASGSEIYKSSKVKGREYGAKIKQGASDATLKMRNMAHKVKQSVEGWWRRALKREATVQDGERR